MDFQFDLTRIGLVFDSDSLRQTECSLTKRAIHLAKKQLPHPTTIIFDECVCELVEELFIPRGGIHDTINKLKTSLRETENIRLFGMDVIWSDGLDARNISTLDDVYYIVREKVGMWMGDKRITGFFLVVDEGNTSAILGAY